VDVPSKTIQYLDSFHASNKQCAERIRCALHTRLQESTHCTYPHNDRMAYYDMCSNQPTQLGHGWPTGLNMKAHRLKVEQLWWAKELHKELHNTKYYSIINFFTLCITCIETTETRKHLWLCPFACMVWLVIIVHTKHSMNEINCSFFYSMPSTRCSTVADLEI